MNSTADALAPGALNARIRGSQTRGLPEQFAPDRLSAMATVTVREVCKEWPKVLARHSGEELGVTSNGRTVAWLRIPSARKNGAKVTMPDFHARLRKVFGKRALSASDAARLTAEVKSAF